VSGVTVNFTIGAGGGSVQTASPVTDATGVATVGGWTLGATATQTLTATAVAGGLAGNPVQFSASVATQIVVTQQPPGNANSGVNFNVTVQLRNSANVLSQVTGLPLTISLASGAGALTAGSTALTVNSAAGTATFNVNITGAAGPRTLQITGTGVGNVVTTTVTIN
jgi:adhesin/invasin